MRHPAIASAASATVGFEMNETDITVGERFFVTLTVQTDATLGDFEGNILYNSAVLEYVDGPTCIAGGDGMLRVEDIGASSSLKTRSYIMTFKAIGYGDSEFGFVNSPEAYEYESGEMMSVSASSRTITVSAPATASANSELASIKISPSYLTPTFDPKVTEYSVIVDATTTRLVLSAVAQDAKAIVTIDGNKDFQFGNNDVKLTVTSESGESKIYTIHVQKEENKVEEETDSSTEPWLFHATVKNGMTVIQGSYEYTVVVADETISIPSDYVKTSIKIDGCTIPVYQLKADVEDDYLLLILQNQYGQNNLYRYDRLEKTIQRYTGDRVIIQENDDNTEFKISQLKKDYEHKLGTKNFIIVILIGFGVILLVSIVVLLLKLRNNQDDDFY